MWKRSGRWVSGTSALKSSENFPVEFCRAVAQYYSRVAPRAVAKRIARISSHNSPVFQPFVFVLRFIVGAGTSVMMGDRIALSIQAELPGCSSPVASPPRLIECPGVIGSSSASSSSSSSALSMPARSEPSASSTPGQSEASASSSPAHP